MAEQTMTLSPPAGRWRARLHAAQVIQRRSSLSTFYGLGIYITMAGALLVAAVMLHNDLRFARQNLVFVTRQPLFLPLFVSTILTSFYLALSSAIAASRERERGTMQVLFFGPVDETAFLFGLFLAQLKAYLGVVVVVFVWSNLVTWLLNLQFEWELAAILLFTIATAAAVIASGLLVASWSGGTRATLFYFVLAILLLVGLQIADDVVANMAVAMGGGRNDPVLVIRNALASISGIVAWISPYAQVRPAMDALVAGRYGGFLFHLFVTLLQTVVLLGGSILLLRRKGAGS